MWMNDYFKIHQSWFKSSVWSAQIGFLISSSAFFARQSINSIKKYSKNYHWIKKDSSNDYRVRIEFSGTLRVNKPETFSTKISFWEYSNLSEHLNNMHFQGEYNCSLFKKGSDLSSVNDFIIDQVQTFKNHV